MAQEQSPDAKGIEQLVKAGSDLGKLHRFEFTLRFGTKFSADRAAGELLGFAFESKVERGKSDSEWLITAVKVMYPSEPDLSGLRDKLNAIAATGKGSYEGWKAKVYVRPPADQ